MTCIAGGVAIEGEWYHVHISCMKHDFKSMILGAIAPPVKGECENAARAYMP